MTADAGEGPWRIAPAVRLVTFGDDSDRAALASRLGTEGLDVRHEGGGEDCDLLLVGPDVELSGDGLRELRRVADSDPMIVAAMPRLLLVDAPDLPEGAGPRDVGYEVVPDPRCLYVKDSVARDLLGRSLAGASPDEIVEGLAALNGPGFRVVRAGRAVARISAEGRPTVPKRLAAAAARFETSAPAVADHMLAALAGATGGRRAIAFDLSALDGRHSGTTRLAAALIREAAATWLDVDLVAVATPEAYAAHLGGLEGRVTRVGAGASLHAAAAIRFGQPFLWGEIDRFARLAPVLVLFLLDTIGFDCLSAATDELDALWRFVCGEADGLLFNSDFTQRQFQRRFALRSGLPHRASLHALALDDYGPGPARDDGAGEGVLVIGNAMPHKRLRETAEQIASIGLARPVTVLGLAPGTIPGVTCLPSGSVAPHALADLYRRARVVAYPTVYEGFGFPLLEALSFRRPVLARDLPPFREIAQSLPESRNIHLFAREADLVAALRDPPAWVDVNPGNPARRWSDAARDLREVLDAALAGADRERVIRRIDVLRGRMSYMRSLSALTGDERIDRIAGAAGRLVQRGVAAAGRRWFRRGSLA